MRLACDLCGSQPCMCIEAECRACNGEGEHYQTVPGLPRSPYPVACHECGGEGWIKCDRGGSDCPFEHCYCEAAWERQQEAIASEPPPTSGERHQRAHEEREALRSGRPL